MVNHQASKSKVGIYPTMDGFLLFTPGVGDGMVHISEVSGSLNMVIIAPLQK